MKDFIKEKLESGLLGEDVRQNAGILIKCTTTNRFFLLKRASPPHHGKWALLSGQIEKGEDSLTAIKREIGEEISINPNIIDIKFENKELSPNTSNIKEDPSNSGSIFYYFKGYVSEEFKPTLDHENIAYVWVDADNLPQPLFPSIQEKINNY